MKRFLLTKLADADLLSIAEYTLRTWGEKQTEKYLNELEDACDRFARLQETGRPCREIRPGLYRSEVRNHLIFYRRFADKILIVRILHERMLPARHSFAEGFDNESI